MSMDEILAEIRTFDGVLELAPAAGGPYPEIAWGDHFFYYAPDGEVPQREQPYATIVTKNHPGDTAGDLDHPGRWRLNIHVGRTAFRELTGLDEPDFTAADAVLPHPVYAAQGWIAIVDPAERTHALAVRLLHDAHEAARHRAERRAGT